MFKGKPGKTVAVMLSLIAGITVYFILNSFFRPVSVVVARADINESAIIQSNQLQVVKIFEKDCQPNVFHSINEVKGKMAASNIFSGQQIIGPQLSKSQDIICGNIKANQTLLTLNTQQASWPKQLQIGNLVSVIAVYQQTGQAEEVGVGRIVSPTSGSVIRNLKNIQEAQSTSPSQTEISFITSTDEAKRILSATQTAQLVYLMPRHPSLGGVE